MLTLLVYYSGHKGNLRVDVNAMFIHLESSGWLMINKHYVGFIKLMVRMENGGIIQYCSIFNIYWYRYKPI